MRSRRARCSSAFALTRPWGLRDLGVSEFLVMGCLRRWLDIFAAWYLRASLVTCMSMVCAFFCSVVPRWASLRVDMRRDTAFSVSAPDLARIFLTAAVLRDEELASESKAPALCIMVRARLRVSCALVMVALALSSIARAMACLALYAAITLSFFATKLWALEESWDSLTGPFFSLSLAARAMSLADFLSKRSASEIRSFSCDSAEALDSTRFRPWMDRRIKCSRFWCTSWRRREISE
mmetsp:Transcript_14234/g.22394  ORF Transcript_14234/g.22394 Transcript_14234/m.22394 type:complete len:238 (-) Transcript_14234:362-1075(-)